MTATRERVETLRLVAGELLERQPMLDRLVLSPMLDSFFRIMEDLIGEIEQLKKQGGGSPDSTRKGES